VETKTKLFEQVIGLYNDVATANLATRIAVDLQDKMHTRSLKKEREGESAPAVLFSKELNLKVEASDGREPLITKDRVLTKAEIIFDTFHKYDDTFCSFYLTLYLHSRNNVLGFCIAKTKDETSKDYGVNFLKKELRLQKGDSTEVKFSSEADMLLILNFCNEAIAALNKKVDANYQLIPHFGVHKK
jgi:hypothetical protein